MQELQAAKPLHKGKVHIVCSIAEQQHGRAINGIRETPQQQLPYSASTAQAFKEEDIFGAYTHCNRHTWGLTI